MGERQKEIEAFFEALYRQHYKRLLRQANAYFGFKKQFFHFAENAVQETFNAAFETYDSFHLHPNQGAWLSVVLRRRLYLIMQEILSDQKHLVTLNESTLLPSAQADEVDIIEKLLQKEENRVLIMRLMKPLSDKEKEIVHMFYYEEKSAGEVAMFYNTTEQVVNTQLYRIRKKMKKIFESGVFLLIYLLSFHI